MHDHLHEHYSQCYFVHKYLNYTWYNRAHSLFTKSYLAIIASNGNGLEIFFMDFLSLWLILKMCSENFCHDEKLMECLLLSWTEYWINLKKKSLLVSFRSILHEQILFFVLVLCILAFSYCSEPLRWHEQYSWVIQKFTILTLGVHCAL